MTLTELLKAAEKQGALSISAEMCKNYGCYDNSGIILDCGQPIKGVLFSLDLSLNAIAEAEKLGYNVVLCHHPAIYGGIERISVNDPDSAAVAKCLNSGISVISMHLNFDAAAEGIDYHLMLALGGKKCKIMQNLSGGGYGRVYRTEPCKLSDYVKKIKQNLSTDKVIYYGDGEKEIKTAASFCGAGCDGESIAFAADNGADVFVSSDLKHHQITSLVARGINVIQLTHYSAECYGFCKMAEKIKAGICVPSSIYRDDNLL